MLRLLGALGPLGARFFDVLAHVALVRLQIAAIVAQVAFVGAHVLALGFRRVLVVVLEILDHLLAIAADVRAVLPNVAAVLANVLAVLADVVRRLRERGAADYEERRAGEACKVFHRYLHRLLGAPLTPRRAAATSTRCIHL